ncbi:MAG: hypothetical protein H6712_24455 [Myxococcales bacterium]|nr:hypothetical protein [Myxococcales bacterium]
MRRPGGEHFMGGRASGTMVGLGLAALIGCSGGASSPIPYTGAPFGADDGDEDGDTDTDDGPSIDLDGGVPPGDDGLPPADNHGDCCEANGSPGCENKAVELCVCASDEWCCDSEWDSACAALIEALGCGHCTAGDGGEPPPPGGDDGASGGECCSEHSAPGCDEPEVEACVCAIEPFCCDTRWSAACTAVLEVHGCGECGAEPPPPSGGDSGGEPPPPPGGDSGGEPPPGGDGDCCADNGTPGCDDATIESCVCASDAYCCDTEWDGVCVGEVGSLGCGTCGGGDGGTGGDGGPSACCAQQAGAGCAGDPSVESCVCAMDDYCCSVFWDLTCAGEVESFGCGSCS